MNPMPYQICPSISSSSVWSFAQLDIRDRKKDLAKDAHISASEFMYIVYMIGEKKERGRIGIRGCEGTEVTEGSEVAEVLRIFR